MKKINQLDEKKIGKLAKWLEKLDYNDIIQSKNRKSLRNSQTDKSDKIQSFNKFNINYIQTDNINFGNVNINLNTMNNINNNKFFNKHNGEDDKLRSSWNSKSESKNLKKIVKFNDNNDQKSSIIRSNSNSKSPLSSNEIILLDCSMLTIIILSNWGNQYKVGITEIQLFDTKFQKINIIECHVLNGNDHSISK